MAKSFIFSLDKPPVEAGWRREGDTCMYVPECDYGTGLCYHTQQECLATVSSSSSSSVGGSSSSVVSGSSSGTSSSSLASQSQILLRLEPEDVVVPSDLKINIFEESVPGAVQVAHAEGNNYRIYVNSEASQNNPLSFIFQIRDERVTPVNIRFNLFANGQYETSASVSKGLSFLHSDILSAQSIDTIHNWFLKFWEWYEGGMTEEPNYGTYSLPRSEVPQQYNFFLHAVHKILSTNNLNLNQLDDYVESHIDEFKSYCLDKQLMDDFFNKRKPFLVDCSLPNSLVNQLSKPPSPIIKGSNFLGVSSFVWDCIVDKELYKKTNEPFIQLNISGSPFKEKFNFSKWIYQWERQNNSFDCRAFSEASLIYLRNQLKSVCPSAVVDLVMIPGHALLNVDLGDTGPCCEGRYAFEATGGAAGKVYDLTDAESERKFREIYRLPSSTLIFETNWDDSSLNNKTKWENNPEQVARISGIICECLEDNIWTADPSHPYGMMNQTEINLHGLCKSPSPTDPSKSRMYEYIRDYYSYGTENKNTPLSNDCSLPETPQGIGCSCKEDEDCVKEGMPEGYVCCELEGIVRMACVPKEDCKQECESDTDCDGTLLHCCAGVCVEDPCSSSSSSSSDFCPENYEGIGRCIRWKRASDGTSFPEFECLELNKSDCLVDQNGLVDASAGWYCGDCEGYPN